MMAAAAEADVMARKHQKTWKKSISTRLRVCFLASSPFYHTHTHTRAVFTLILSPSLSPISVCIQLICQIVHIILCTLFGIGHISLAVSLY